MSSWLGYTVYPTDDTLLEALRDSLEAQLLEKVVTASRSEKAEYITPTIYSEWGALGRRCSTTIDAHELKPTVVEWIAQCSDRIEVVYIAQMSDTSDAGVLTVYTPSEHGLFPAETRKGDYDRDREIAAQFNEYFPEEAAQLLAFGDDHITELTEKYDHRPLLYYG